MFGFGKKYPYIVEVLHSGHHPYMGDPTYDMFEGIKQEAVRVMARNHEHAIEVAMRECKVRSWRCTAWTVRHATAGEHLLPGRKADFYRCGQN
jgi:hypothetical protein